MSALWSRAKSKPSFPPPKRGPSILKLAFCAATTSTLLTIVFWVVAPMAVGFKPTIVASDSMRPTFKRGDLILYQKGGALPKIKNVAVFRRPGAGSQTFVHRVNLIDHGVYTTKGDANQEVDSAKVPSSYIVGTAMFLIPWVGNPVVIIVAFGLLLVSWLWLIRRRPSYMKPSAPRGHAALRSLIAVALIGSGLVMAPKPARASFRSSPSSLARFSTKIVLNNPPIAIPNVSVDDPFNEAIITSTECNGILYISGTFTEINGQQRDHLAAIDLSTGLLTDWAPSTIGFIFSMAPTPDCSVLYVGGGFLQINGENHQAVAGISTVDGSVLPLSVPFDGTNDAVIVWSIKLDTVHNYLDVGGTFAGINGQNANFAVLDLSNDGTPLPWDAAVICHSCASATIHSIALDADDNTVYLGGTFDEIESQPVNGVVALDQLTGSISWVPSIDGSASTIAFDGDRGSLYISGDFTTVGGQARDGFAALDITTGDPTSLALEDSIDPPFAGLGNSFAFDTSTGTVYAVSSNYTVVKSYSLNDGTATGFSATVDGAVLDLSVTHSSDLMLYGVFSMVNGENRINVAGFSYW